MSEHPLFVQLRAAQDELTRNIVRQFGQERADSMGYLTTEYDGHTQVADTRCRLAERAWIKYKRTGA